MSRIERSKTYNLFGQPVVLCDGLSALDNTGWRTWAGSWLLAKHFERHPPGARVLDLSCGTGLTGVALALAGHEVVLCDMEMNVGTIQANVARNVKVGQAGLDATVVGYSWGQTLPEQLQRPFDVIACGDLLYHVWSGRLQNEFLMTLQLLHRKQGEAGQEFVFGFQVRSGRQEEQVLNNIARRLGLVQEEFVVDRAGGDAAGNSAQALCEAAGEPSPLLPQAKYRLVRLRPALDGEDRTQAPGMPLTAPRVG